MTCYVESHDLGFYVSWFEIPHDFTRLPELQELKYGNLIAPVIVSLDYDLGFYVSWFCDKP